MGFDLAPTYIDTRIIQKLSTHLILMVKENKPT